MARKQDSKPEEERSSLSSPVAPSAIRGGLLFIGAHTLLLCLALALVLAGSP